MERLKKVIEQYGRWAILSEYAERIEACLQSDFSHAVENSKALLETIGKEICQLKGVELGSSPSINSVMKKAFTAIGYTSGNMVTQISTALANIGQQMGDLRNEVGVTSHGKSLEEIKARNNNIDELTKEFLIATTVTISCFLIRAFENENPRLSSKNLETSLQYLDSESFNEYWDDTYGEFVMGDYSFLASEILFNVDRKAYITEAHSFSDGGEWTE
jgi:hypothetical protein